MHLKLRSKAENGSLADRFSTQENYRSREFSQLEANSQGRKLTNIIKELKTQERIEALVAVL
jgi:hypothetical protein